jgi:HEXXH motif-containing protein
MLTILPPLDDLTVPTPGSTTARDVLSRAVGRLLRELRPARLGPLDRVVASLVRDDPAPLASILRRPHVGALLRTLRSALDPEADALKVELVATLAFDLASVGALRSPVTLRALPPRITSLVARCIVDTPDLRSATLPPPLPATAHPYHVVEDDLVLALADNNPLAMVDAHPDKGGNAIDLGGRDVDEWLTGLREALGIVRTHLPEVHDEMRVYLHQVVPVGYFGDRHLSASYREAIGTVYLSLHPDAMTMAEALVHEFQHNKLNALLELDDVIENAFAPLHRSPLRPDVRPLHGVLLAVHAMVPVALLYERMIARGDERAGAPGFAARFRDVVEGNREGTRVLLDHARPTARGRALIDELARWDAHFAR